MGAAALVRFVLVTVVVLALVLLVARALRLKGVGQGAAAGRVRVLERHMTGRGQALLVVAAGGRTLLVGQTSERLVHLADLGPVAPGSGAVPVDPDDDVADVVPTMPPKDLVAWARGLWAARRGGAQAAGPARPDTAKAPARAAAQEDPEDPEDPAGDRPRQVVDLYAELYGDDGTDLEDAHDAGPAAALLDASDGPDVGGVASLAAETLVAADGADRLGFAVSSPPAQRRAAPARAAATAPGPAPVPAPARPVRRQTSVQSLSDADLSRVLMELDARTVLVSLKGAPSEFAERVGTCFVDGDEARRDALVRRAVEMRDEVLDPAQVRAARAEVAAATSRLLEWGEIGGADGFSEVYARLRAASAQDRP